MPSRGLSCGVRTPAGMGGRPQGGVLWLTQTTPIREENSYDAMLKGHDLFPEYQKPME